jgi:hypothetical protein
MKHKAALLILCCMTFGANGQTSLQEQINAMKATQSEAQAAEQARQAAYAASQAEAARKARQQAAAEQMRQDKLRQEAQARQDKLHDEALADKKRDQSYEDEERKLALESKKLDLQMKAAKAKRADDYIDQDLGRQKAQTDVIQSEADATRNVSKGAQDMMTGVGAGEANKNKKGLFNW